MTSEEFVRSFRVEKDWRVETYMSDSPDTAVAHCIRSLSLSPDQTRTMRMLLDQALTDAFYTVLLVLDGCGCIGDMQQQNFRVQSEDGTVICCGDGEIEALASRYFQDDAT